MRLLHAHILEQDLEASVYASHIWPPRGHQSDTSLDLCLRAVDPAYPRANGLTFLLFDEGQDTYGDVDLWNTFLKSVGDGSFSLYRVILFCSYGSPSSRPVSYQIGVPPILRDTARIYMWSTETSIRMLLNRKEFDEVVSRFHRPLNLHPDLADLIFDWTVGHAGAVADLLRMVSYQVSLLPRRQA